MKAIQELGEEDETQAEINELREQMNEAGLPENVRKQAERELSRLELPPAAAEHGVIRTYLEWIVSLPWSNSTDDNLDIPHARKTLDADHYDIEKVKERILDHLAVRKLKPDARGSILSFVGPPGVGKTSSGSRSPRRSGANSSGSRWAASATRPRSADIAAPTSVRCRGRSCARCATRSERPRVHDRRDRQDGHRLRGDPASAMLEVLDPEQNLLPRSLPRSAVRPRRT